MAAAGIDPDAHYRAGISTIDRLPVKLGHEVAGIVEEIGNKVTAIAPGDPVCLHYLVHCRSCEYCLGVGLEQFCPTVQMIGSIATAALLSSSLFRQEMRFSCCTTFLEAAQS